MIQEIQLTTIDDLYRQHTNIQEIELLILEAILFMRDPNDKSKEVLDYMETAHSKLLRAMRALNIKTLD